MDNMMDLLEGYMTDDLIGQLSQQLGGADKQQTAAAAQGAISTLMSALNKNAAQPEGANALAAALDRDHDGSILDDITGMLSGNAQGGNSSMLNGAGILKHVLGGKQGGVIDMISKMSGMSQGNSGNLLTMLAPMVLGALGKTKRQNGLDGGGLSQILQQTVQSSAQKRNEMGLIGKFLDQDGDGSVMDDIAGMGMNVLGNLFKR